MGLFVAQATLPSGIQVSNVYMSFNGETVYTSQCPMNVWEITSSYRVYSDSAKSLPTNTRVSLSVRTSNTNTNAYSELYLKLKETYPNSIDHI